jgi:hypothetical protein
MSTSATAAWLSFLSLFAIVVGVAGCASTRATVREENFQTSTPFSKTILGTGDVVCWSVKRAFLNEGYMLDRSSDTVFIGTKEFQPDDETNVTLRLQTTCADNRDGTSTVFATASREESKLQIATQHRSAGVGWATITVPVGSEKALRVMKRETVQDAKFYERFYDLVQRFAAEERSAGRRAQRGGDSRPLR